MSRKRGISDWLLWFLDCFKKAVEYSETILDEAAGSPVLATTPPNAADGAATQGD
jgi:hypothetical protein